MTMYSVGALLVAESSGAKPQGIITDRDLVKLIGQGLDPAVATVSSFAGPPLETASVDATAGELFEQMHKAGVRRLPLVDTHGRVVDVASLDDLLVRLGKELGRVAEIIEREFRQEHPLPSARERAH